MMFDDAGRDALFAHLVTGGYTGTLEGFLSAMRAQSYASEVRLFCSSLLPAVLRNHAEALQFAIAVCGLAQDRFTYVHTGSSGPHIGFGRNKLVPGKPERRVLVTSLVLDFQEEESRYAIRCQVYVNGEFRRCRTFAFEHNEKGSSR